MEKMQFNRLINDIEAELLAGGCFWVDPEQFIGSNQMQRIAQEAVLMNYARRI